MTWQGEGHEYIRNLVAELGLEFTSRKEGKDIEEPCKLGVVCTTFLLAHNAELDTVDHWNS